MIVQNLQKIRASIPQHVTLVAVSKTKPIKDLLEAYHAQQRIFGENKAQEMKEKHEALPKDIEWHFIGHLQKNKIKYIIPFVALIHSVDSLDLLEEINIKAQKINRIVPILLQVHIAQEEHKFGFDLNEIFDLIPRLQKFQNIQIKGLMGMGTFTNDQTQLGKEFDSLKVLFNKIKQSYNEILPSFDILSMGMSNDYELAIQNGSNMVRIGSTIFGERNYNK
jgi:pyridoxal phosphate enzyme (YggS family)